MGRSLIGTANALELWIAILHILVVALAASVVVQEGWLFFLVAATQLRLVVNMRPIVENGPTL